MTDKPGMTAERLQEIEAREKLGIVLRSDEFCLIQALRSAWDELERLRAQAENAAEIAEEKNAQYLVEFQRATEAEAELGRLRAGQQEPKLERPDPLCPQCQGELEKVTYPGGVLNRDQWESVRAGDWLCRKCPDNDRAGTPLGAYWWDSEVFAAPLSSQGTEPAPAKLESKAETIIAICGAFVPGGWAHPGDECVQKIVEVLEGGK